MRARFGEFTLDSSTRELRRGDDPVRLSPKAFELLLQLTDVSPRAVAKQEILDRVWPATFISALQRVRLAFLSPTGRR